MRLKQANGYSAGFGCLLASCVVLMVPMAVQAQPSDAPAPDYRAGKNFIPTKVYTEEQDQQVLELFKGLRVTDVSDGMDKAGRRQKYRQLGLPPDDSVK